MSHRPLSSRIVFERRPIAQPRASDFRLVTSGVPELRDGEISLANIFLSMDPAIRGFLDDRKSYMPLVAIGETVRGMTLGRVLESRNPAIREAHSYARSPAGRFRCGRESSTPLRHTVCKRLQNTVPCSPG
jgi:NADPH-dependent curcumin reductase CurA